jgi:hypothetical protein
MRYLNEFSKDCQPRTKLPEGENGDLLEDSHDI